jgi:hypothetical protein
MQCCSSAWEQQNQKYENKLTHSVRPQFSSKNILQSKVRLSAASFWWISKTKNYLFIVVCFTCEEDQAIPSKTSSSCSFETLHIVGAQTFEFQLLLQSHIAMSCRGRDTVLTILHFQMRLGCSQTVLPWSGMPSSPL